MMPRPQRPGGHPVKVKKNLLALSLLLTLPPGLAWSAESYLAAPSTGTSRFLLLDRPDPGRLLITGDEKDLAGTEQDLGDVKPPDYSPDSWNDVREQIETGRFDQSELHPLQQVEVSTETPLGPSPEVEFRDSGTSLSVTGRKVITLNYSSKHYINDQTTVSRPRSQSLFEITQQMQVRMQGKVGQKITVNVDYDDTRTDKQDISVVYQGDPGEVVQSVSFGDIDLSLPATEFVSYNKQLFGIRTDLKTNHFKLTFVGSRTKGITKTKQFTGNTQFQSVDILDTSYLRHKYYDVIFQYKPRLPIKPGSERIYIDLQNQAIVDGVTVKDMTGKDMDVQSSSHPGHFQILNPGTDYVMDYVKGIVTFNRTLNPQEVVMIDYQNADGTWLSKNKASDSTLDTSYPAYPIIIKTPNDTPLSTVNSVANLEVSHKCERQTYYSIGQTNIVHDDGHGSFTLKVQDLNRNEVTYTNTMPKYPNTIDVDFEQGIFNLQQKFTVEGSTDPDSQIYSAAPVSKRIFRVEYSYRFKTFILEPSIVTQSDNVRVDGVKLNRNEDYFIDYDSGFITFYYPERIKQDSKIEIIYEVSPFGGIGNQSMVGGRISSDLGRHFSLGSTMLYQGGIKSNTVPNITDLTNSMLVYEGDAQLKGLNIFGLRAAFGGEVAQSRINPNLNDNALVDNMEGIKQEDAPSMDANSWQIASNPGGNSALPSAITWNTENIKAQTINSASTSEGSQQVLNIAYDIPASTSAVNEVSIVYPLSTTGLDFSQKTALELVVKGDNANGPLLNIHLGQIDEDADGQGGMSFNCEKGISLTHAPKSEDTNCDSQIAPSEDIGWLYAPDGTHTKRYGAGNGRLDSEDLNKNGRLDPADLTGGDFGYIVKSTFTDNMYNTSTTTISFTNWRTLYAPIYANTEPNKWAAIKQVRISLKRPDNAIGEFKGVISFARIAVVGNNWTVSPSTVADTGSVLIRAVNNIDNTGYRPIYEADGDAPAVFNKLYGSVSQQKNQTNSNNLSEQTLAIEYSTITAGSTAYIYRKFTQPIDISQHGKFNFLLKNAIPPTVSTSTLSFRLQIGDENNYFRAEVPMSPTDLSWKLITIDQVDLNGDGIPDIWVNGCNYPVKITSKGSPSLQQVSQIIMGVSASDAIPQSGTVYVDEIYVSKPLTRTGNARKVEGSFEVPGWFNFGGKHRYVDKNFQTPVTAISNQDNEQQTGYLNINRLSFLPMNFTAAHQLVTTPNTAVTGGNNLVTSLQQGRVKSFNGTAAGSLNVGALLPKLAFNYTKTRTDYMLRKRRDDLDLYAGNFLYTMPFNAYILPNTMTLNYSQGRNRVGYDPYDSRGILNNDPNTDERTDTYGAALTFIPWRGSTFNPTYNLQQVSEKSLYPSVPDKILHYPKAMQQTAGFASNFMFFSWLNPSVNYSISTAENNNLSSTTITIPSMPSSSTTVHVGDIKAINRTAQGAISLTLNMNELMPRNRLLRSMVLSSNYQIQDGDSWQNVEKSFDSKHTLWLRDSLKPTNNLHQRNSVTLRDTISSSQRWQPFEGFTFRGRTAPLNTLSLTNNFSNSVQRSEVTQTRTDTVNRTFPDMILSMSQLEILTRTAKWAQNATVNFKYSKNTSETKNIGLDLSNAYGLDLRVKLLNYLDTSMSGNSRFTDHFTYDKLLKLNQKAASTRHYDATIQSTFDYMKFRFTPKVDYVSDVSKGGLGIVTQNTWTVTPSVLIKTDLMLPKGLKLPFVKRILVFTNRITWTSTLSYAIKRSPVTVADNNQLFSLNSSADYEAAKNLRLTFNAGLQRAWYRYLKQEEYISYQFGSTLTFQF